MLTALGLINAAILAGILVVSPGSDEVSELAAQDQQSVVVAQYSPPSAPTRNVGE